MNREHEHEHERRSYHERWLGRFGHEHDRETRAHTHRYIAMRVAMDTGTTASRVSVEHRRRANGGDALLRTL